MFHSVSFCFGRPRSGLIVRGKNEQSFQALKRQVYRRQVRFVGLFAEFTFSLLVFASLFYTAYLEIILRLCLHRSLRHGSSEKVLNTWKPRHQTHVSFRRPLRRCERGIFVWLTEHWNRMAPCEWQRRSSCKDPHLQILDRIRQRFL